jgi:regulator of replication initiation timing
LNHDQQITSLVKENQQHKAEIETLQRCLTEGVGFHQQGRRADAEGVVDAMKEKIAALEEECHGLRRKVQNLLDVEAQCRAGKC